MPSKPITEMDTSNVQDRVNSDIGGIGIQMCAVVLGLLTAMCYALGRSQLLGWHDAAGIPLLTFTWPFQDVLLTGFLSADRWFYVAATVFTVLVFIAIQLIATDSLEHFTRKFSTRRTRGEAWDQVRLRYRLATKARLARLGEINLDPVLARSRHIVLGCRGKAHPSKPLIKQLQKGTSGTVRFAAMLILGALTLVFIAFIYFTTVLFIAQAYRDGEQRFLDEYFTATGSLPYTFFHDREGKNSKVHTGESPAVGSSKKAPKNIHMQYAFVRVTNGSDFKSKTTANIVCGWLVQASSNQLLLLSKTGLQMLSFGDQSFTYAQVNPDNCEDTAH